MIKNSSCELIPRRLLVDSRGYFFKVIDGKESSNPFGCEVYLTSAKPGESRGGHYHLKAQEWFTLIKGDALLKVKNVDTGEETEYLLSETKPETVYVPPRFAHYFKNQSNNDFLLLAFSDILYDKSDTVIFQFE
jgi:dTDP-4-dehydrorhamnose 3,5-epimerase-like enzyme